MILHQALLDTPVGRLRVVATPQAVVALHFPETNPARDRGVAASPGHPMLLRAARALEAYFLDPRAPLDLPLAPRGTPFQLAVWGALREIPPGETRSYAAIAERIGRPEAPRAVGAANARNPLSIFVPCHRVVGSSGALTGYAGGLARKAWLLRHEAGDRARCPLGRRGELADTVSPFVYSWTGPPHVLAQEAEGPAHPAADRLLRQAPGDG